MDFNNEPDFGDLPLSNPNSQAAPNFPPPPDFGAPAGTPPPPTPTDTVQQGIATKAVDKKQFIYTLLIALFITLVIGSITLFGVTTYMKANEPPPPASRYTFGNGVAPSRAPSPVPTKVVLVVLSPTPIPDALKLTPTPTPESWNIRLKDSAFKLNDTGITRTATMSASLFGPVDKGTYVCTPVDPSENQYFTYKKSDKVFETLCDADLNIVKEKTTCVKYNPTLGVPVQQTLYPRKDCSGGSIEAGTYVLYSKVSYNCNEDGVCTDTAEAYSGEMTVE